MLDESERSQLDGIKVSRLHYDITTDGEGQDVLFGVLFSDIAFALAAEFYEAD